MGAGQSAAYEDEPPGLAAPPAAAPPRRQPSDYGLAAARAAAPAPATRQARAAAEAKAAVEARHAAAEAKAAKSRAPAVAKKVSRAPSEDVVLPAILAEAIFLKLHLLMDTFRRLDKDNSGKLSRDEFVLGMEKMGLTSDQGHQLFKMVDKDRSGEVELSELLAMRDAVAKRERAKRLEGDDEVGEVVDGTLLQMLRNYVLGFVWQTPPPLVPHDPERTLQRAERSGDSAADVFKDGPLVVPLSGHIKEVEKAIAIRINRMFTEVEALAATVQLAAIKDQEVALTMRDECKRHADALARYRSFLDQTWAALDGVKMRLAPLVEDAPGEGDWVHFGPVSRATALPPARRPAEAASECM